jgi:HlyD family secretion protein
MTMADKSKRNKRIFIIAEVAFFALFLLINVGKPLANYEKVKTDKVMKGRIVAKVSGPGHIKPTTYVDISSSVMGRITHIYVSEGDRVLKGDKLMELDSVQYSASVNSASANLASATKSRDLAAQRLETARADYERQVKLHDEQLISDQAFANAETAYRQAQTDYQNAVYQVQQAGASLTTAQDTLGKTVFVAPIDGIVASLPVREGENAIVGTMNNPGTQLMTISNLDEMEVDAEIDETDVLNVKVGQEAEIQVDAMPDTTFKGEVIEVGNAATNASAATVGSTVETSVSYLVKIVVKDPRLRPDMSCTADIITDDKPDVLNVPIQAVVRQKPQGQEAAAPKGPVQTGEVQNINAKKKKVEEQGQEGVYLMKDNTAIFVPVTTGISDDTHIEVSGDLQEGETIISGPFAVLRKLKDGMKVRLDTEESKGGGNGGGRGQ